MIAAPTIFGGNDFLNTTIAGAGGSASSGFYSYSTSIAGVAFITWLLVIGGRHVARGATPDDRP